MLLLDDGTRFTLNTAAATKSAKASRPVALNWWYQMHKLSQPPTRVFLDFVVQPMMARQIVRQQPVHQRSFLEAIGSQLSALPPPAAAQIISPPRNL